MKNLSLFALFLVVFYAFLAIYCAKKEISSSDPISTIGHGTVLDNNGKPMELNEKVIKTIQAFYLKKITQMMESNATDNHLTSNEIEQNKTIIYGEVKDEILANALWMDWLLTKSKPTRQMAQMTTINNALRWQYVLKLQKNANLPKDKYWAKGLDFDLAKKIQGRIGIEILAITDAGGEAYCKECIEKGVPIPKNMFGEEWKYIGDIENEFLSPEMKAEVWMYESESPKGVCIALPRFPRGSDRAQLFGVICLGTVTNKACFFDNPSGEFFKRGEVIPFKKFVGGTDLVANSQGTCSDCHAGENPYIVHPDQPVFSSIITKLRSTGWYDPLVDASWPQNPGPTNMLEAVSSDASCISCHVQGYAGRFPQVSSELPGYCGIVLTRATNPGGTMPPGGGNRNLYLNHINALLESCGSAPTDPGVVVDFDPPADKPYLSAPMVFGPIYACATAVQVRNVVLDAKVSLLVNGTVVKTFAPARNTEKIDFLDLTPFNIGDKVEAIQEHNGNVSALSAPVFVKSHKADYPSGLPAPLIDPTLVYQCANSIAVRHVPGSIITVYSNDGDPLSYTSGGDWTVIPPKKRPFDIGDKFTVKVSICGDESPLSLPVFAVAAPSALPMANFNPFNLYIGQEIAQIVNLTNGSATSIEAIGRGDIGGFSTPISWFNHFDFKTSTLGRAVSSGDQFIIRQELCGIKTTTEPPGVTDCKELPAPRIDHPIVGANYVVVTSAVPGARIRVYDGSNNEIGDGSGFVITLSRPITGADQLSIVQQVGECTSRQAYLISVRNSKGKKSQ